MDKERVSRDELLGIYLHVPFCAQRCAYCDFAIVAGRSARIGEYFDALEVEIRASSRRLGTRSVDTIYLGGGTPSHVYPQQCRRLIRAVRDAFDVTTAAEISLEANPEDVTPEKLDAWLGAGVTRITIGLQALEDEGLQALGRPGSVEIGVRAVEYARAAAVESLGADLIFGRPGQTLESWRAELAGATELGLDHVSCYALETTSRTPLVRAIEKGRLPAPDPDLAALTYEHTVATLRQAGLARYEISNFARAGSESRHNLKYWLDQGYAGFGMSAASYVDGARWTNPRRLSDYVTSTGHGLERADAANSGTAGEAHGAHRMFEPYDADRRAGEAIVFGLRLDRGVDLAEVSRRHGQRPVDRRRDVLAAGARRGLVEFDGVRAKLAERGRLLADELFVDLL
ncbi:MAG: radical SAM family heme chaperone HemW [Acidobacteriota bacterium]|nr:MAG: radical SAM family heme chaperone HemW [Acidobacteriota bacterium]